MPNKPKRPCNHPGCPLLVTSGYCDKHKRQQQQQEDSRRGTAHQRGYNSRWARYSKWFLKQPGNQICKLQLDAGCAYVSQCVDHVIPPSGADDPLFWDSSNHQGACIHCNSVKGHRTMRGDG